MTLLIPAVLFKKQAKLLVKHWPRPPLKHTQAIDYLAQLYGFKHHHYYHNTSLVQQAIELSPTQIQAWFPTWVQQFARITHLNQIQTKSLILQLWHHVLRHYPQMMTYMYQSQLRFHGACLDFVSNPLMQLAFDDKPSIKNVVESLGVPHVEVAAIQVNQQFVNFDYLLNDQDQVEVFAYPHCKPIVPLYVGNKPRFVLDVHLGGLARYLRLCNFDCWYSNTDQGDEALAQIAADEQRIFLSRDIGALKRSKVQYGHWVRQTDVMAQWQEIISLYQLQPLIELGKRCVKCNTAVNIVPKAAVLTKIPEKVAEMHEHFTQCPQCQQIYWQGSHYARIAQALKMITGVAV
jgi:hypothetical protein